jgi:Ser-Thr-rich glycosyl-phosphatidyl-inositol-anchored membrane family/Putative peptidoglycan binding domain
MRVAAVAGALALASMPVFAQSAQSSITVSGPSAGATISSGQSVTINWQSTNAPQSSVVSLAAVGVTGSPRVSITNNASASGSYTWTVPTGTAMCTDQYPSPCITSGAYIIQATLTVPSANPGTSCTGGTCSTTLGGNYPALTIYATASSAAFSISVVTAPYTPPTTPVPSTQSSPPSYSGGSGPTIPPSQGGAPFYSYGSGNQLCVTVPATGAQICSTPTSPIPNISGCVEGLRDPVTGLCPGTIGGSPVQPSPQGSGSSTNGTAQASASCTINGYLHLGMTGASVSCLQSILARDSSLYPSGLITGYYGSLTASAVMQFQTQQGIASSGDWMSTGFGAVGPRTRAALSASLEY